LSCYEDEFSVNLVRPVDFPVVLERVIKNVVYTTATIDNGILAGINVA